MTLLQTLLAVGALILAFFLIVDAVVYLLGNTGDRGEARRNRRLMARAARVETRIESIAREEEKPPESGLGTLLDRLLESAGSDTPRERVFIAMAIIGSGTFFALMILVDWMPMAAQALVGVLFGLSLPLLYLRNKASARQKKFAEQFPDVLDLIVRSLRIGHPLSSSMRTIAADVPAPAGPEFEIAARQVTYGRSTAEAIDALAARINTPDVRFFSVAVQIHNEAGGNLGEILGGLSTIIRSRFKLFRKIKALTAEGRFSAYFLSAFPLVMIFAMNAMQPGYYEKVSDFEYFTHLVSGTSFLLIVNVIAMRMITSLEV